MTHLAFPLQDSIPNLPALYERKLFNTHAELMQHAILGVRHSVSRIGKSYF